MAELPSYGRRSVVKASFPRNRQSGAWAAHARYLARPGAQHELTKGLGFDAEREDVDLPGTVKAWEKSDELMWRFIVSPEDAERLNLHDHVRELVGQMERDLESKLEWVAIDHHTPTRRTLRAEPRLRHVRLIASLDTTSPKIRPMRKKQVLIGLCPNRLRAPCWRPCSKNSRQSSAE